MNVPIIEAGSLDVSQIIGGCIAVIVAGMPAIIALLKIRELSIHVNGRLDQLLKTTEELARKRGFKEGSDMARHSAERTAKDLLPDDES